MIAFSLVAAFLSISCTNSFANTAALAGERFESWVIGMVDLLRYFGAVQGTAVEAASEKRLPSRVLNRRSGLLRAFTHFEANCKKALYNPIVYKDSEGACAVSSITGDIALARFQRNPHFLVQNSWLALFARKRLSHCLHFLKCLRVWRVLRIFT